uniref:START domain-containing protein n=1 Tax=Globisporangium ultimum (strain ATCC 200006 / CBS 805.95 / DAOM BR144) TaxID=431595 RepID=K3WII7_GLOUD
MDRFKLDDMEDEFDTVEPMRPSSFDMSFTLSDSRVAATAAENDEDEDADYADDETTTNWKAASKTMLNEQGPGNNANSEERKSPAPQIRKKLSSASDHRAAHLEFTSSTHNSSKNSSATTAQKLEEKAQETISIASLCGKIPWRLVKRNQDVHIYRPATLPEEESSKLYFRISCEVKANLNTILEYLTPNDTKSYFDIESQVFPGLLHASVVKRMELPDNCVQQPPHDHSMKDTASSFEDDAAENFPRLQVKWHASRFAGRFVKPVDFFFVEYANVETMADGRKRGYGYVRSVESFKGDELATRLNNDDVAIPQSVSKCKRAVINKGIYLVSPSADSSGTYEVTFMMVIDFKQQFPSTVGAKIINNFAGRLMGIRELLFNTLFQPVSLVSKEEWKPARSNNRKWVVQPEGNPETTVHAVLSASAKLFNE